MFYVCVWRFDVIDIIEIFLKTKQSFSPSAAWQREQTNNLFSHGEATSATKKSEGHTFPKVLLAGRIRDPKCTSRSKAHETASPQGTRRTPGRESRTGFTHHSELMGHSWLLVVAECSDLPRGRGTSWPLTVTTSPAPSRAAALISTGGSDRGGLIHWHQTLFVFINFFLAPTTLKKILPFRSIT